MIIGRRRLVAVALGIGVIMTWGVLAGSSDQARADATDAAPAHRPAAGTPPHHTPATAPASQPNPHVEYYCPMHPHVVSDQPGKCPICGMALQQRAPAPHHPDAAPSTPHNPMH